MPASALDLTDFQLNPKFSTSSLVHFDELDPFQMLHNSRYAAHVERATVELFRSLGYTWKRDSSENPDQMHVVRDFRIEFLSPAGPGAMEIRLWVERLGTTSCVYGFGCYSADGRTLHARGTRAIVKLDPDTRTPIPWSESFREAHRALLKDLPALP
ncbi:MAG: acyl-CoA thioesterase [Acidobacteria bacterium]|nr:acyl-CoA thioesterase [Acidobacteriota bacterium]